MNPTSLIVLVFAFVLTMDAQAQTRDSKKRVSTEQAWSICLKRVDKSVGGHSSTSDAARTAAFRACMFSLGHREGR